MTEYYVPSGPSTTEFVEKKSRFIGQVSPAETEEEARAFLEQVRKQHRDARHNCWCYLIRSGNVVRCSDDGEPQGTAGQPMLEVFQRAQVTNAVCVVTRYFGGVLLGTGGLFRAYTRSARDALEAAGISVVRRWVAGDVCCDYARYELVRREVQGSDGVMEDTRYGADVDMSVLIPEEKEAAFSSRLKELTAGTVQFQVRGEAFRAVPLQAGKKS